MMTTSTWMDKGAGGGPGATPGVGANAGGGDATGLPVSDMHCHLAFAADPTALARQAAARGVGLLDCTVTPEEYERHVAAIGSRGGDAVAVGVGLHPWWVPGPGCERGDAGAEPARSWDEALARELDRFETLARERDARVFGEVGVDLGRRHVGAASQQAAAFRRVARLAAALGGRVLSVHAVRSCGVVLDALEEAGCVDGTFPLAAHGGVRAGRPRCVCVLHWFSGTSDELRRAVRAGCLFSVNPAMVGTRRGRAYLRAIPPERLLLETDLPGAPGDACALDDLVGALRRTLGGVAQARGDEVAGLAARVDATARAVLAIARGA